MAVARYGALEAEDGSATFEIEAVRPGKGVMIARLAGITGRDTAERLTNLKLYVPRERLPEPEQDTYYHADLIGLAVVGTDATELGTVAAIHNFGAGDLLEVKPPFGPNVLVPFTRAVVPVVDIVARRLVMEPPLGLFAGGHAEPARDRPESQDCSEP